MSHDPALTDDLLRAYVDGQLDPGEHARVGAALAGDAAARAFVQREQALRDGLARAFEPVLAELVPERLLTVLHAAPSAPGKAAPPAVIPLAAARQRRAAAAKAAAAAARRDSEGQAPARRFAAWPSALGMAACLLLGVFVGQRLLPASPTAPLVASAELVQALDSQSAARQEATAPVQVGISFMSQAGRYCRSFSWPHEAVGGLACRVGDGWQLQLLAQAPPAATGALRQAASSLPPAVLQAIDAEIAGPPLDAAAEQTAIQHGWKP